MTDQRARANELYRKLGDVSGSPTIHELETHDIDLIFTALADERRRVWEEAAKVAEDFDRLTCAEMKEKYGLVLDVRRLDIGENVARCIRAQAHAGQEG